MDPAAQHQPMDLTNQQPPMDLFDFPDIDDQVTEDNSADQYEEEEAFYVFEFGKHLTLQELKTANYQCKLVGINSDFPFMQIGQSVYSGTNRLALGTDLVFTKPGHQSVVKFMQTLNRRVQMVPVRLKQRTQNLSVPPQQQSDPTPAT